MKDTKGKSNVTIYISNKKPKRNTSNFYQFMSQMERMLQENERGIKNEKR